MPHVDRPSCRRAASLAAMAATAALLLGGCGVSGLPSPSAASPTNITAPTTSAAPTDPPGPTAGGSVGTGGGVVGSGGGVVGAGGGVVGAGGSGGAAAGGVQPASAVHLVNVPPDFTLPDGATVAAYEDRSSGAEVVLASPGLEDVIAYYRRTLGPKGYRISQAGTVGATIAAIEFSGRGWTGEIGGAPGNVAVDLHRG